MLEYDWEQSVGNWLCTTAHELRKAMGPYLQDVGLTVRQVEVLACLSQRNEMSQSELADALSIEANTLAGVIKRMIAAGLLVRRPCPEDRRCKRLSPTKYAEEVWQKATEVTHFIRAVAIAGMSPEEVLTLKNICDRMRTNLATLRQESAPQFSPSPQVPAPHLTAKELQTQ